MKQIEFQTFKSPLNSRRNRELLNDVSGFFSARALDATDKWKAPKWERMAILLHAFSDHVDEWLDSAEFLIVNSWGEIFFESVDLSFINGIPSQCYKISEYIWKYNKNAKADRIPYFVFELGKGRDDIILRRIESGLNSFMKSVSVLRRTDLSVPGSEADSDNEDPLLLDLL